MEAADSRKSKLKDQIDNQIEEVAKSICEGGDAIEAMCMLNSLTRELVTRENRLTGDRVAVDDRYAPEWVGAPALHCPNCRSVLHELRDTCVLCYRCESGHAFSARSLLSIKARAREAHLFSLCEEMIEEATFARYLANECSFANAPFTDENLNERANELMKAAENLSGELVAVGGPRTIRARRTA